MASEAVTSAARNAQKLRTTTSSEVERRPLNGGMEMSPRSCGVAPTDLSVAPAC